MMGLIIESRKYLNKENKWLLSEDRLFNGEILIYTHLQVFDIRTLEVIHNDIVDDDVWILDWEKFYEHIEEI